MNHLLIQLLSLIRRGITHPTQTVQARHLVPVVLAALALVIVGSATPVLVSASHGGYHLLVSSSPDRSDPQELDGASISGNIYVFVMPESGVRSPGVRFWINDPQMVNEPYQTEGRAPFDLAATAPDRSAFPFDTSILGDGAHTITAHVKQVGTAQTILNATFTVGGEGSGPEAPEPELGFTPSSLSFSLEEDSADSAEVTLETSNGDSAAPSFISNASWLSASPADVPSTPATVTVTVDSSGLAPGSHTGIITAQATGFSSATLNVTLNVSQTPGEDAPISMVVSKSASRSSPVPLEGQVVEGDIYVFTTPDLGVQRVLFWIDNPAMTGTAYKVENNAPFDLAGTVSNGSAFPFDTNSLPDGTHSVTARAEMTSRDVFSITTTFTVANGSEPSDPALSFTPSSISFSVDEGGFDSADVSVGTSDGSTANASFSSNQPWLTVSPSSGDTPATVTVSVDASDLSTGTHSGTVTAQAARLTSATLNVSLTVSGDPGDAPVSIMLSTSANRSNPVPLEGQTVQGNIYVFTAPDTGVNRVTFWIDNPAMAGAAYKVENNAPFDLAGTASNGSALPYNSSNLPDGPHSVTAWVEMTGSEPFAITASFTVTNASGPSDPALAFTPTSASFAVDENGTASRDITLQATGGATVSATFTSNQPWLTISPNPASTPATVTVSVDAAGLSNGNHSAAITAESPGHTSAVLNVSLNVGAGVSILLSESSSRSNPVLLNGQTVSGDIYVFTSPDDGVQRVRFFLDDPEMNRDPIQTENGAPYDLGGTASNGSPRPFDTTRSPDGLHNLTAHVEMQDGSDFTVGANFITDNGIEFIADQVHLSWVGDPSTTLTVVWRTINTSTASEVEFRQAGSASWQTATGSLRTSGTTGTLHEVTITGLTPGTAYEYRVRGDNSNWSEIFATRTAPAAGPADFDAAFVADTGLVGRADGLATGTQQIIDEIANLNPLLVLLGGDYAYFNTDKRYGTLDNTIDAWFNQMQPVGASSPMMPTYGNHEILLQETFADWAPRFATPEGFNQRRNYSFDIGDTHFVSIFAVANSQGLSQGTLNWIEQDILSAKAAGQRWIVPFFHVAPFADGTNHPSNLALRAQLGPLFESLGVQLVLTAHDQAYERTFPLTDVPNTNTPTSSSLTCYGPDDGTTWVKISPGGKLSNISGGFSPFATEPAPEWTAVRNNTIHNFGRLAVTASGTLTLQVYGVVGDGTPPVVIDEFQYNMSGCGD